MATQELWLVIIICRKNKSFLLYCVYKRQACNIDISFINSLYVYPIVHHCSEKHIALPEAMGASLFETRRCTPGNKSPALHQPTWPASRITWAVRLGLSWGPRAKEGRAVGAGRVKSLGSRLTPGVPVLSGACLGGSLISAPLIDTYNKVHVPRFHTRASELLS